ncbi:MAG: ABC transporter permease [Oscillospiraceae bacterium]|jgi:rhamnose transport system permease protein|nr:ABC transporter permease [Oscillospiraceae bacterium]
MKQRLKRILLSWEAMLIVVFAIVCVAFNQQDASRQAAGLSKKDVFNLASVIKSMRPYMLYSFMTLGIALILAMGDIDISAGASAALSAAMLGILYKTMMDAGVPSGLSLALALVGCVATGTLCGAANGFLVIRFKELFPMIITLTTQLFFRGVAFLLLGGGTLTFKNDKTFDLLKTLYNTVTIGGISIPIVIIVFLAFAAVFYVWLHLTANGRRIFALGTNSKAAYLSGVRTDKIKFTMFTICGLLSSVTAVFFVGATSSSIRADSMVGYEMYAIAAAVLGGFSTSGGKGSIVGVVISLFLFGVIKIGLGTLYGFADSMVNMSVGVILILSTLLPNVAAQINAAGRVRKRRASSLV